MVKRAVVVGATGMVGQEVVRRLLDDEEYGHVVTLARRKLNLSHEKLEQLIIDFEDMDEIQDYLRGSIVFCLLGTTMKRAGSQEAFRKVDYDYPLKLGQLAQEAGAGSYLIVTATGSNARSKIFYSRVKGQLEEELQRIPFERLHILRPSLLLGERSEFRLGERMATMLAPIFSIFLVGSLKKYKPIHASTIATSMIALSKEQREGVFIHESDEIASMSSRN